MKKTTLDKLMTYRPFMDLLPDSQNLKKKENEEILKYLDVPKENLENITLSNLKESLDSQINENYKTLQSFSKEIEGYLNFFYYPLKLKTKYKNNHNHKPSFKIKYEHPIIDSIEGRVKNTESIFNKFNKKKDTNQITPIKDLNGLIIVINDQIHKKTSLYLQKYLNISLENTYKSALTLTEFLSDQQDFYALKDENNKLLIKDFFKNPQIRTYKNRFEEFVALYSFFNYNSKIIEVQVRPLSVHQKTKDPKSPMFHKIYEHNEFFVKL